jgi:YidC/Oxa1 family membrane protein insertase
LLKRFGIVVMLLSISVLTSGCLTAANPNNPLPINPETGGIWDKYFVFPFKWLLMESADLFNGSYGLAIVVVTLLVRFLILPLMMKQLKSSKRMQELQPELTKLRDKYKNDPQKAQQEMIKLYQVHNVNPLSGCLPILVQMPILIAFYHAIVRTEQIRSHDFLWLELGKADPFFILPIVAAITTYLQQWITMRKSPSMMENPQMKMMLYAMPIMILVFAISLPSALSLYWVIGNLFSIAQTYFIYRETAPKGGTVNE